MTRARPRVASSRNSVAQVGSGLVRIVITSTLQGRPASYVMYHRSSIAHNPAPKLLEPTVNSTRVSWPLRHRGRFACTWRFLSKGGRASGLRISLPDSAGAGNAPHNRRRDGAAPAGGGAIGATASNSDDTGSTITARRHLGRPVLPIRPRLPLVSRSARG